MRVEKTIGILIFMMIFVVSLIAIVSLPPYFTPDQMKALYIIPIIAFSVFMYILIFK